MPGGMPSGLRAAAAGRPAGCPLLAFFLLSEQRSILAPAIGILGLTVTLCHGGCGGGGRGGGMRADRVELTGRALTAPAAVVTCFPFCIWQGEALAFRSS